MLQVVFSILKIFDILIRIFIFMCALGTGVTSVIFFCAKDKLGTVLGTSCALLAVLLAFFTFTSWGNII